MSIIKLPVKTVQRTHLICPVCDSEKYVIDHYLEKGPTTWSAECSNCNETHAYTFDGTSITAEKQRRERELGLALLAYCGNDTTNQLHVLVDAMFFYDRDNAGQLDMDKSYFYNEHTCPTNFLGVELVCHNKDSDPHGVFQYVRGVTYAELMRHFGVDKKALLDSNNCYLEDYFTELGKDVEPEVMALIRGNTNGKD